MVTLESVKTKNKKRPGRGISAGQGKTAGRGTKGQKSRAGHNIPNRHEGGQTPLSMRFSKLRGIKSRSYRVYSDKSFIISLDQISANFKDGETVSKVTLAEKGLIGEGQKIIKILNNGKLTVKLSLAPEIKVSKSIAESFTILEEERSVKSKKPAKKSKVVKKS